MSAGTAFGKYFLLKKIAAGGMGEILLAKLKGPEGFEKLLVIKRILQHHVENQEFLDMFFAEARVAAQLTHSNIVQIFDMGEIDDSYFIAMEYVHGKALRDVIDRARQLGDYVHPGHAVEMISKLCSGLSYAHNARDMSGTPLGIIHRDINPHNMLISYAGDLKIIDFGIAKSEMSMHQTETGTIKGKFVYMSPEQSAAEKLDKRSDIFAVGICLYETLTFVNPFAKANIVLSLDAIQRKDPPPPSQTNPRLACFDPIIQKALAKKPEDRYQDCSELRDDLQALLQSGAVPRPPQHLADYMHDLFEEQIEQEKRMIIETDSANTTQIEAMRRARQADARGRSGRMRTSQGRPLEVDLYDEPEEELAAHASAVEMVPERHSRLPFLMLLLAIVSATMVSAAALVKFAPGPGNQEAYAMQPVAAAEGEPVSPEAVAAAASEADEPEEAPEDSAAAQDESEDKKNQRLAKGPVPAKSKAVRADPKAARLTALKEKAEREERERKEREEQAAREAKEREAQAREAREREAKEREAKAREAEAQARADQEAKEKAPPPPPAQPSLGFGVVSVSSNPFVKIIHRGQPGQTFSLKSPTGIIVFGSPGEAGKFYVKLSYRVKNGDITFTSLTATPWAIVKGKGGIGLGKTPLSNIQGDTSTVFELLNPKEGLRQRITVRYTPP